LSFTIFILFNFLIIYSLPWFDNGVESTPTVWVITRPGTEVSRVPIYLEYEVFGMSLILFSGCLLNISLYTKDKALYILVHSFVVF